MKFSKIFSILFLLVFFIFTSCKSDQDSDPQELQSQNRLAQASSPYLLEHADNPVDWYEWGPEALEKANKEDKPIIISVGYAACHWCHVMEEESFMDSTVAAIMNRDFVSIKIDREERPDIDKIYMNAAVLLNGSGGWPLNAIALPDGRPFFAGTYFPKEQWKNILTRVAEAYKTDKADLVNTAEALTEGIRKSNSLDSLSVEPKAFTEEDYVSLINNWKEDWDEYFGGYAGNQKFPLPVSWEALMQYHYFTGDEAALNMVNTTLEKMARGGIYDQLGGGFARYTTDPKWLVPHFEKMLYDNAQLISLYSKAYKLTGNEDYRRIVVESIEFVERELSNEKGAFYSSMNADTEGEEGKYYVWSSEEIDEALNKKEAEIFKEYYNVEPYGNWEEGKNVLYINSTLADLAAENDLSVAGLKETLASAKEKVLELRQERTSPTIDDKVLTAWNALMLQAYLDAFTALGDKDYLDKALKIENFLSTEMINSDGELWRSYKDGKKSVRGFLDDYAFLIQAYIKLYEVTFNIEWLENAERLTGHSMQRFRGEGEVMFYYTDAGQNELIVRKIEVQDEVMPSSNSVMAGNLFKLGNLMENKEYLDLSDNMLNQISEISSTNPSSFANWTNLLGIKAFGVYEIAIVGENAFEKNLAINREYLPTSLFMGGETENLPLLKGKLSKGETLIYVCQNKTCKYPVSEVKEALGLLDTYMQESDSNAWWN